MLNLYIVQSSDLYENNTSIGIFMLLVALASVSFAKPNSDTRILKISDTNIDGTYHKNDNILIFRARQIDESQFELTVGRPGDLITNTADLNAGVLIARIAKNMFVFTQTNIDLFSDLSPKLYSVIPASKKDLRHNVMLLSLIEYYGKAPVGHIIKDGQVFD